MQPIISFKPIETFDGFSVGDVVELNRGTALNIRYNNSIGIILSILEYETIHKVKILFQKSCKVGYVYLDDIKKFIEVA